MGKEIYGVDTSKKVTPLMVRDAIIRCFREAHKEALEELNRKKAFESEAERGDFQRIQIDLIVRSAFDDTNTDFENPTKEGIRKVMGTLIKFAARFREEEIIKKHYDEIMALVEKISD